MTIDFNTITELLDQRSADRYTRIVAELQAAVAAGMVPNKLFVDAKDIINRAFENSAKAFLDKGPHIKGRDGQAHHQSDWWLDAYDADAFLNGAHSLPSTIKRATKAGMVDYLAFLATLLPVAALLTDAKPLIKKRGELPVVKSAKQLADEADQMTCQCCGRGIFAATGTIAHHGYERPGHGFQTASCMGAKQLPFEVSRDTLAKAIVVMQSYHDELLETARQIEAEEIAIDVEIEDRSKPRDWHGNRPTLRFDITRENFAEHASKLRSITSFDSLKSSRAANLSGRALNLKLDIKAQQTRYDGWKQTHKREGGEWVAL